MTRGVVLPYWPDRPAEETFDVAANASALDYSELWLGEMATFDAFFLAGYLAARSPIPMTIGPLAAGVRDPVAIAMGVASVASVATRPVGLALGASTPVVVSSWHGRPWEGSATRLRETVEATRSVLAGGKVSYEGAQVRTRGFRLRLSPPPCPITVAAFGPESIRTAAQLGDRMVVNLVTPNQAGSLGDALTAAANTAGTKPPPLAAWVVAAVDPTKQTYAQLAGAFVAYLAAPGYGEMFTAAGFGAMVERARAGAHPGELARDMPAELIHAVAAVGDTGAVNRRLDEFAEAGVSHIGLVPATAGDPAGRRTLSTLAPAAIKS